MTASRRPASVTVIAWLWFVSASFPLLFVAMGLLLSSPTTRNALGKTLEAQGQSLASMVLWSLFATAVLTACGMALLKGKRWGRTLYLISTPIILLLHIALHGIQGFELASFLFYGLLSFFLLQPTVSEYLRTPPADIGAQGKAD